MPHPESKTVIGRFAPSPTGPLHTGSLYTALASFLQARAQHGKWLLRIDDLDTPRNVKGAIDSILTTLDTFGLHWDDEVVYQSRYLAAYHDALNELSNKHKIYPCTCSRKDLAMLSASTAVYNGLCRHKTMLPDTPYALRIKTDSHTIAFEDGLQGKVSHNLATQHGDFILKRKDEIIAYSFAVVIDDSLQQVNQVVRGFDLLFETPKHIYLQQVLDLPTPDYMHVPVIVDGHGYKLSKQTRATAVNLSTPNYVIFDLLNLLKQNPPLELREGSVRELIDWAIKHWQPERLNNIKQVYTLGENERMRD